MPTTPTTPAQFFAALPDDRREALAALDKAIRKAVPKLKPKMWTVMGKALIGYGEFPYTFSGGREGTWFIIGLSNNKANMSLHISATDSEGYLAEQNMARLGKVSGGRSCVNFKRLEDLNLPVVTTLVKQAARMRSMLGNKLA